MIFFQHKRIIYSLICLSLWCIIGCASVGNPPSGGRKDTTPPVLDTAKSSPILPLNTKPQKLVFYFDEYIEVRNYSKKLIVSPPLVYNPIVKYRGKKVEVFLDAKEVLKENATYTFNFSDAIVDFHESNPYKNFTYVFSTGPTIDSLSIIGSVMDAKTGEAVKDISILLFDQLSDSAIAQVKPFYSTKTDDKGLFSLSYLRQDTFRIIALKDGNANYIYDVESEWIGFLDTLVMTTYNDSTSYDIRISPTDIQDKLKK